MSRKFWEIARRIQRNVEIALYAIFVLSKLPELQAHREIVRVQEISAENAGLCEKLSIERGSDGYNQCLLHVGDFRGKVKRRAYDEVSPW